MGHPREKEKALLFLAVSYQKQFSVDWLKEIIFPEFGELWQCSEPFSFSYSSYYEKEMGANLRKVFAFFQGFYDVEQAPFTKQKAVELEQQHVHENKRTINLDPGYLTLAKFVLTTTKNYDHRLYIGNGIFGDIQLRYRKGIFTENPWTYPDYKNQHNVAFILNARNYLQNLVKTHEAHI